MTPKPGIHSHRNSVSIWVAFLIFWTSLQAAKGANARAVALSTPTAVPVMTTGPVATSTAGAATADYLRRIESLNENLKKQPKDLDLRERIAALYLKINKPDEVVQVLKSEMDRLSVGGVLIMAQAYEMNHDALNQQRLLELAAAMEPPDVQALVSLGNFYKKAKRYEDAILQFRKAITTSKNFYPAYDGLIQSYQKLANHYEERAVYTDLIKVFGPKATYYHSLCRLFFLDGYFSQAKEFCVAGIREDDKFADDPVYLALIVKESGEIGEATKILRKAAEQFQQSPLAQAKYADFLAEQKNFLGAQKYYHLASKLDLDSLSIFVGLGTNSVQIKDYPTALKAFDRACEIDHHIGMVELRRAAGIIKHAGDRDWANKMTDKIHGCYTIKKP